jgi:pimeloyl-ACP methyl ester carboxylesterase
MRTDHFVDNNGVSIRVTRLLSNHSQAAPLVFIPGMIESADDYAERLTGRFLRDVFIIDLRGRGRSDIPETGYSFADQGSDLDAVVRSLDVPQVILMGFSTGGAFALAHTLDHPKNVSGLIIVDYPPHYPAFTDSWADDVLHIETNRMSEHAARMIVRESSRVVLSARLNEILCPVLIIRGTMEGSLLPEHLANLYIDRIGECTVVSIEGMAHDPFEPSDTTFLEALRIFL